MEFDFEVIHTARVKNLATDALSRLSANGTDDKDIDHEVPVLASSNNLI